MEIEVGEYVRTKDGIIDKVERFSVDCCIWHCENGMCIDECNCIGTHLEDIANHSKQLIDLIEVGDYVNGYRVVAIMEDMKTGEIHLEMTSDYTNEIIGDCTIYNDDINSIVTHEQFASIEYKVEEDKYYESND